MNSTRIAVEVQDTGAGIDPSHLGRIFEPFEQAGPRTRGLGLGCSISRALADAQGATLTAESGGHGRGATFRLGLEALPDLAPAAPAPASRAFALESRRVRRSSEAGFVDHLVKPITLGRLEEAIDRFFDRRQTADRVS